MCSKIKISPYLVLLGGLSISAPFPACEAMDVGQQPRRSSRISAHITMEKLKEIKPNEKKVDCHIAADMKESKKLYEMYGTGKKRPRSVVLPNDQSPKKKTHI